MISDKENNIFAIDHIINPEGRTKTKFYEYAALHAALYQTIFGSYVDYGFKDRATLDIFIEGKIKSLVTAIKAIMEINPNIDAYDWQQGVKKSGTGYTVNGKPIEQGGVSDIDFQQVLDNNWISLYMPYSPVAKDASDKEKADAKVKNIEYTDGFLKNFDRAVALSQELTIIAKEKGKEKELTDGNMINVSAAQLLLEAKLGNIENLAYEGYRKSSSGLRYKYGSKGDKSGYNSGELYQDFKGEGINSAVNQLKEKKYNMRVTRRKILLRGLACLACAAVTVASASVLLATGGIVAKSLFAPIFVGNAGANFGLGLIGSLVGGTLTARAAKHTIKHMGNLYRQREDLRQFLHGSDKYASKNGEKLLGYYAREKAYYTAKAVTEYFEKGQLDKGKTRSERREYRLKKKYWRQFRNSSEKKTILKRMEQFNYVRDEKGTYQTLTKKLKNVVQRVPEQREGRKRSANEATGDVRKYLDDKTKHSFDDLIEYAGVLKDYENDIGVDNTRIFRRSMTKKVADTFRNNVFESTYGEGTLNDLLAKKDVASIKELLEAGTNGEKQNVDSVLRFLKGDAGHADKPINSDLGLSLRYQYDMSAGSMADACKILKSNDDDVATIISAVNPVVTEIESLSESKDFATISASIDSLPVNDNTKNYLHFMLEKKEKGAKLSTSAMTVSGTVTAEISALKDKVFNYGEDSSHSYNSIRADIMNEPTIDLTQKQELISHLDKQAKRFERKQRDEVRESAYKVFSTNDKITDFDGLVEQINKIEYSTVASSDTYKLYNKDICRGVTNESEKELLKLLYQQKIEKVFLSELDTNSDKYTGTGKEVLTNITQMLQKISNHGCITDAQKARLIDKLTGKIEIVLENALKLYEINFLEDQKNGDMQTTLRNYTEGDYKDGGLREFFKIGTPKIKRLEERINVLVAGLSTIPNLLQAKVSIGPQVVDYSNADSKLFTSLYFDKDAHRERILNYLNRLQTISQSVSVTDFTANGPNTTSGSFINNIKTVISNMDADVLLNDVDKLSILLVIKKRCIAAFKLNMQQFLQERTVGTRETFDNYLANSHSVNGVDVLGATEFATNVTQKWINEIAQDLDNKINSLLSGSNIKLITKKSMYTKLDLTQILGATNSPGAGSYMTSEQMNK